MSSAPPPPPSPAPRAPNQGAPPRVVRPPPWAERQPTVSVDYDRGRRTARAEVDGVGTDALPARHRLRVEGTRWQRDWKVSEAAARVLGLPRADAHAVDAVLNCWAGRFARRNFPLLIRIDKLQSTFHRWEQTASNTGEYVHLTKELLTNCESIEWQVDELEKTISVASRDPAYYGLDEVELSRRRNWTGSARNQVGAVRSGVEKGKRNSAIAGHQDN